MCLKRRNKKSHTSIQIWYEGNDDSQLDLDINIWQFKTLKSDVYIDFGLKISDKDKVKKVFVYFPFLIDNKSVTDLGKTFKNPQILKGIFNENYSVASDEKFPKEIIINDSTKNDCAFSIYQLSIQDDVVIENKYDGTVLSFEVKNSQSSTIYYRFRISTKQLSPLLECHHPKNSFFESAFIETVLLDFRINENRNQNLNLIESINRNKRFKLTKINFFLMSPTKDDLLSDGVNLIYKRQLESYDFWESYVDIKYNKMSVYKSNNIKKNRFGLIDDFSCFAKINYRKCNILTILLYLIVLLFITIVFSNISNVIWHYLEILLWR